MCLAVVSLPRNIPESLEAHGEPAVVTESRRNRKAPNADVMVMFDSQVTANSSYGRSLLNGYLIEECATSH